MLLEDFIITVYCWIDDMYKKMRQGKLIRERGPAPRLSDAELITLEIVGEFLGIDTDKGIHFYFKTHWSRLFPHLGDRTAFLRQSANLWAYKQQLRNRCLSLLGPSDQELRMVDGFPMPLCNFKRAHFSKLFKGIAAYGYCASKHQHYYGFKGHLRIDERGTIRDRVVTPAPTDEREVLLEMKEQIVDHVLGDKGYILNPHRKEEFKQEGIELHTPLRSNMPDSRDPYELKANNTTRRLIETVISQLSERFHIQKIRARDLWHLTNRVVRKVLAHTVCQLIARSHGIFDLQFDRLVMVKT